MADVRSGTGLLLAAWSLLALGDSAREGEFSVYGLIFVLVGFGLVVTVVVRRMPIVVPDRRLLALPVTVCLVAAIAHPARRLMHTSGHARC